MCVLVRVLNWLVSDSCDLIYLICQWKFKKISSNCTFLTLHVFFCSCVGIQNVTPAGMAEAMLTAIDKFIADTIPVYLRSIVVCLPQLDIVEMFCAAISAVATVSQRQQQLAAVGKCLTVVCTFVHYSTLYYTGIISTRARS